MISDFFSAAMPLLVAIMAPVIFMGGLQLSVERFWPIEPARKTGRRINVAAFLIGLLTQVGLAPGLVFLGTFATNRLGGGFIALPPHGWGFVGGFLVFFVAVDFLQFLFHRAEHGLPWLWAFHSLHHSDKTLDATTSVLHHWLSQLMLVVFVAVPVGLVFKVPPSYLALSSVLAYYTYVYHANVRLDFGRFAWTLNSPGYHRLHHSTLPEHFDCNYAGTFPIFDVLFGSYRPARKGEWPTVGLGDGSEATDIFDVIFWPIRGRLRALTRRPLERSGV
jgi:sterol desaturase/sphingolipid hydroxylase (fatty acid hydroxylase superfamily)